MVTHTGGCHCGRVRFEVTAPRRLEVKDCDCSICSKCGYLHLIVPRSSFKLLSGSEVLTTYEFNTGTAKHLFCSVCGIKAFYIPRSHPDGYSVNARGETKLAGVGQRLIRGGAHLGAVVVVAGADLVREPLVPVYKALELDWDPASAGSVADEVPSVDFDQVLEAIRAGYAREYELVDAELDEETLELARRLAPEHASP